MCNPISLAKLGVEQLPFAACASPVMFTGDTGHIIRVYKDQGEQRLAVSMARLMAQVLPPEWEFDAVTYVPSTLSAYRHRGFDHAQLLASELAEQLGRTCDSTLARPRTHDQRGLSGAERIQNLAGSFTPSLKNLESKRYLIVDDVMTTGATLCAASRALLDAGAAEVMCMTFARV